MSGRAATISAPISAAAARPRTSTAPTSPPSPRPTACAVSPVEVSRQVEKKKNVLRGRTQINLFFEASTRTQSSFEIAGKRLGADVMNM
ncbi:hypothetical protein J8J27_24140, partial [Mycobacterium tuberculosis]|nr:hypothetical protein [Mycobacterium tuberculosis]